MKILVLMPLDERWSYIATGIYRALPEEIKEKTFAMPMFMEYTRSIGVSPSHTYAIFDALVSAKNVYKTALEADDDLIILGNCSANFEFDAVFNFQDEKEDLPYEDKNLDKVKELVSDDENLTRWVNNLHAAAESKMTLHDFTATADFLTAYLGTDPKLDKLTKEYKSKLKEIKNLNTEKIKEIKGVM